MKKLENPLTDRLFNAILSLQTKEECYRFFEDLCTVKELMDMSQRFGTAEMLFNGKSYGDITENLSVSPGTVSRVNRALLYGTGGYQEIMQRLPAVETSINRQEPSPKETVAQSSATVA